MVDAERDPAGPGATVHAQVRGGLGILTLDRPAALNALDLGMIRVLRAALDAWAEAPAVRAVVIRGAGGRALCSGGDVRAAYQAGLAARNGGGEAGVTRLFFEEEYRLNWLIHDYPKPYIALIDGIAMGGGLGISIHGSHRVVTERAVLAMPETAIGLFPDVGAGWFLSRCPGDVGTYLGLVGARLDAADALWCGLATHFVPSGAIAALTDSLATVAAGTSPDALVEPWAGEAGASALAARQPVIDRCFCFDRVEDILAALNAEGDRWSADTAAALRTRSPTSVKVTLRQLRQARGLDYPSIARMDFRLSQACMAGHDFYEGIRALLVDKDRRPRWSPDTLAGVTGDLVAAHFAVPPGGDLDRR